MRYVNIVHDNTDNRVKKKPVEENKENVQALVLDFSRDVCIVG